MDNDQKFTALALKLREIREAFNKEVLSNRAEHNKRVEEINSVAKMPGQKGDKGDKGDRGEQGKPGKDGEDGKDGKDAPVITSAYIAADDHLMFVFNDGTEIDAGQVGLDREAVVQYITNKQVTGEGRQEVFIGDPLQPINYPAIILSETVVDGETVFEFKVNVP